MDVRSLNNYFVGKFRVRFSLLITDLFGEIALLANGMEREI